jgi:hypothetical protein
MNHWPLSRLAAIVLAVVAVGLFFGDYAAPLDGLLAGSALGVLILVVAWLYARFGHEDVLTPGEDYLTAGEVASLLSVKPSWVYTLAGGGKIPHVTVRTGPFSREPGFPFPGGRWRPAGSLSPQVTRQRPSCVPARLARQRAALPAQAVESSTVLRSSEHT